MKATSLKLVTATRTCAALFAAALVSTTAMAQSSPASVPSSFHGTYELTYANAQPGSPLTNGTAVSVVIAPGNVMCVAGYTLSNPILLKGNPQEAAWTESTQGIQLSLSSLTNGFNEINVGSASGTWWGQLKGSKVSNVTTGCGANTPPPTPSPDMTKINELFKLAQQNFAQYFPSSANATNQTLDGFIYRAYPNGIYLAINNGDVYVMGGTFGNEPAKQGSLEAILSELTGTKVDIPAIPEGDYKLTVSGTISTFGFNTAFPAVVIDKIDAPKSSDIDDIRKAVKEALKDINFVGEINVSEVKSSGAEFSFRIEFDGTASGVTVGYKLLYVYTKL